MDNMAPSYMNACHRDMRTMLQTMRTMLQLLQQNHQCLKIFVVKACCAYRDTEFGAMLGDCGGDIIQQSFSTIPKSK